MKENILYIDDEQANLDAFRMVFGEEYNIILCKDPKEVFKALKENEIKVVISDQRMPEITGLDLCERINKIEPGIVCIILTAYADVGVTVQAINQGGIDRFMLKPWNKDEMKIALENALEKYNLKFENRSLIKSLEDKNKELKKAKEKAEQSEAKQSAMISNISDVIGILSKEGKIVYKSPNVTKLFGWTPEELADEGVFVAIHPDDLDMIQREFFQLLEKDNNQANVEYRFQCKDGTYKPVHLTAVNLVNNPLINGVLINYHDISERKKAEMEILAFNEELRATSDVLKENEVKLELQNSELIKAKEKAEESDRLKSSFLANMSHEIRTPLNGIMGFAQLLLKNEVPQDKQSNYLSIILNNSQQLLSILNDVLDISKIETGQIVLRNEEVNINNLMDDLFEFHSLQAKKKNLIVKLYKDFDDEFIIQTDNTKLYQVLNNLLSNALKFTEEGTIKFGYKINSDNLEFFVEDSGIGIATNIQSKIFDRFYQGDNSSIRVYGGNGLGLTITKSLIEFMGGSIKVSSKLGVGSKFTVHLPVKKMPQKKEDVSKDSVKKEKITMVENQILLIVEDDTTNYLYLKEVVEEHFKEIIHAKNGLEAVDICKNNSNINLILMDLKMPGMDGFEATLQIKKILPNVPIIAQTAYAFHEDKIKALEAGCDDYVSKPIELQTLINIIIKYKK